MNTELNKCENIAIKFAEFIDLNDVIFSACNAGERKSLFQNFMTTGENRRILRCSTDEQQCRDSCFYKGHREDCPLATIEYI